MPPKIINIGSNTFIPSGASYLTFEGNWFSVLMPTFSSSMSAKSYSLNLTFPTFKTDIKASSSTLDASFGSFSIAFFGPVGITQSLSVDLLPFEFNSRSIAINAEAYAFSVTASGQCIVNPNISLKADAFYLSADGELTGTITIIAPEVEEDVIASDESITFSGDLYVVLNLRTGSHTTYRDGNNNAIAETGIMKLGPFEKKNISDAYINGRIVNSVNFITRIEEETERLYSVNYGIETNPSIKNKKIKLAKGLKGSNWQIGITSAEDNYAEINEIELLVNKSNRRV